MHSCKAAAVSKAKQIGVSREEFIKGGCLSTESIFKKFYDKDIINSDNSNNSEHEFVDAILSQAV